jgi:hypothetical protein
MNNETENPQQTLPTIGPTQEQRDEWRRRYRASGLTIKAFSQQHNIPASRFSGWIYRDKPPRTPRLRRMRRRLLTASDLATVATVATVPNPRPAGKGLTCVLPSGTEIRFAPGESTDYIAAILKKLGDT